MSTICGCHTSTQAITAPAVRYTAPTVVQSAPPEHQHAAAADATSGARTLATRAGAGAVNMNAITTHSGPEDRQRAARILAAQIDMFSNLTYAQTLPNDVVGDGTHRRLTPELKAAYRAKYPDLPVPHNVVFDDAKQKPVGALFIGSPTTAVNLGMGSQHQHKEGKAFMQHIWFVPDNLDLAFSDVMDKNSAVHAAGGH